jgi:hypothetical protein
MLKKSPPSGASDNRNRNFRKGETPPPPIGKAAATDSDLNRPLTRHLLCAGSKTRHDLSDSHFRRHQADDLRHSYALTTSRNAALTADQMEPKNARMLYAHCSEVVKILKMASTTGRPSRQTVLAAVFLFQDHADSLLLERI